MKKLLWLFFPAVVVLLFAVGISRSNQSQNKVERTAEPAVESEQINEIRSGDGRMKLTRVSRKFMNGNTNYIFRVVDAVKGSEQTLFERMVEQGGVIEIPLNSWSPDNKQLMVKEVVGRRTDYWVFKADGSAYSNGDKSLNVNDFWAKTKYIYVIKEVTGWAGPDLLVIYTEREDGSGGPSFWFVTSSRKFLQLREI